MGYVRCVKNEGCEASLDIGKVYKCVPLAICINTDDPDLLTPRMIYEILPDESAAKSNYLRVIDNEGEDYLYPAEYFVLIDLPREIEPVLRASQAVFNQQRSSYGPPSMLRSQGIQPPARWPLVMM